MITKELIKKEIDKLSESELNKVYELVHQLTDQKISNSKKLPTVNLKGKFDRTDVRKQAYED